MATVERTLKFANDLLQYDFCPWANRWLYWMKQPLACLGAAALVAMCCGFLVNSAAFVVLAGIVFVAILGTLWPWIAVRGVKAEAEFVQTRCRLGQAVTVRMRVHNRYAWPIWGLSIRQGFQSDFRGPSESSGIALARVLGWSDTEFEWTFVPQQRGLFPLEVPQADTGFPFGLFYASVPIAMRNELIVWPASVPLDAMPDASEIQTREDRLTDRRTGQCGDMVGTRPFREGDSLRRVHWLQTARHGKVIVIERQSPATCAIRLLIDVHADSHIVNEDFSTLEQGLSLAASVLESLHRQHAFVEVVLAGQRLSVGESKIELRRVMDAIARVPLWGITGEDRCHLDHPSRHLPTIAITTAQAFLHHRRHDHINIGQRYIVVRTQTEHASGHIRSGCDCDSWIEVDVREALRDVLPMRWRRACHVA